MKRITGAQSLRLSQLEQQLGNRTLRTVLATGDRGIVRPDRFSNLLAGTGKLTPEETARLETVSTNTRQLQQLKQRGSGKQVYRVNRAMRDWIASGKAKDEKKDIESQRKAIRGLGYLGVDPSEGTYYVRKRKG